MATAPGKLALGPQRWVDRDPVRIQESFQAQVFGLALLLLAAHFGDRAILETWVATNPGRGFHERMVSVDIRELSVREAGFKRFRQWVRALELGRPYWLPMHFSMRS